MIEGAGHFAPRGRAGEFDEISPEFPYDQVPTNGRKAFSIAVLLLAILPIGCSSTPVATPAAPEHEPLVVFLVRHAEKVGTGEDPQLSTAGRERAETLAGSLRGSGIEFVHSSDYVRTKQTAAPTAAALGLEVELYDPRDLPALVETLRGSGGRHLVVGHSNTTPSVVELLGGEPGSPIDDGGEFDRLYVVTIGKDGSASSVMLRYGREYDPE